MNPNSDPLACCQKSIEVYLKRMGQALEELQSGQVDKAVDSLAAARRAYLNMLAYYALAIRARSQVLVENDLLASFSRMQQSLLAVYQEIENNKLRCMSDLAECVRMKKGISKFKSQWESKKSDIIVSI